MSDYELLALIKEEFYRINPTGFWDFFRNRDRRIPCYKLLKERFNMTYNEILIKSGIPEKELNFVRRKPEVYLNNLRDVSLELGYIPSFNEFEEMGYSSSMLYKYFGSYNSAVKTLGLDLAFNKTPITIVETKDELLNMYISFSNKIGRPASFVDLDNSDEIYNASVFSIRFGGMKGLKRAAGFPIIDRNNNKYTKMEILGLLKDFYINNDGRLSVASIVGDPGLPSYSTILKYCKTTKISDVLAQLESYMQLEKAS